MTRDELENIKIQPLDIEMYGQVKKKLDHIAKPLDGLGVFEHFIAKIGAIQKTTAIDIHKKAVLVMCADNGIVEEGVSQSGKEVTLAVAKAMGKGQSSVGKMAAAVGASVFPIDIGIASKELIPGVSSRKVAEGTRNFMVEPAMTENEVLQAIQVGMEEVCRCKQEGYQLLATGEMGIGNTTTSTAIAAALLKLDAAAVTGRGAGLDDISLKRKVQVIEQAVTRYRLQEADAFTVLQTVGGLDITGLVGVFIGAAYYRIPVLIDGVISAVAAFIAWKLCPGAREYMFPSHKSRELAAREIMKQLGLAPVLDADMALGEGTGAVMMMSLLDIALKVYEEGSTFGAFQIEEYERYGESCGA